MTQVAEKLQPWLAALETRPQRRPALAAGSPRSRRRRASPRSASRRCATRSGGSPTSSPIAGAEFALAPRRSRSTRRAIDDVPVRATRRTGSCSSTAASRRSCRARPGCPAGVRVGSLAAAVDRAGRRRRQRYLGQLADFATRAFAALNTAFAHDGAFVYVPDGVVLEQPLQLLFVSTGDRSGRRSMSHPRTLIVAGERSQARIVETYVGARGPDATSPTPSPRSFVGENAVLDHYKVQQESVDAFHIAQHARPRRAQRELLVALVRARRQARPQRRRSPSRRRRRGVHAERPLSRRRRPAGRQPHDDRSRQAALPEPRDLQGHPRRQGARGLQRQDHRPPGRAEDRRQADQPRAAAVRRRDDQHQAAARDLRRRREVHARRGDRPARRGRDLLPARPRPDATARRATC